MGEKEILARNEAMHRIRNSGSHRALIEEHLSNNGEDTSTICTQGLQSLKKDKTMVALCVKDMRQLDAHARRASRHGR